MDLRQRTLICLETLNHRIFVFLKATVLFLCFRRCFLSKWEGAIGVIITYRGGAPKPLAAYQGAGAPGLSRQWKLSLANRCDGLDCFEAIFEASLRGTSLLRRCGHLQTNVAGASGTVGDSHRFTFAALREQWCPYNDVHSDAGESLSNILLHFLPLTTDYP